MNTLWKKISLITVAIGMTLACSEDDRTGTKTFRGNSSKASNLEPSKNDKKEKILKLPERATAIEANAADGSGEPAVVTEYIAPVEEKKEEPVAPTCENTKNQSIKMPIYFKNPSVTCEFGKNGNLSRLDRYHRARTEQSQKFPLLGIGKVCDVKFNFPEQNLFYDDEVLFTFNDVLLMASKDFSSRFAMTNNLRIYDWTKIRGIDHLESNVGPYCIGSELGKGSCSIPPTETLGTVKLNIDQSLISQLTDRAIATNAAEFKWITLGDNDDSDCQHSDISFEIEIQYIAP